LEHFLAAYLVNTEHILSQHFIIKHFLGDKTIDSSLKNVLLKNKDF